MRPIARRPVRTFVTSTVVVVVLSLPPTGLPAHARAAAFVWPLDPKPPVIGAFDPPEHDWLPGHRGVDLAGRDGQTVVTAGDGVVVFAGLVGGKPVVSVDHPNGIRTTYEPVTTTVGAGMRVRTGDSVGTLIPGHPGCTVTCLHWGARRERTYLDPLALVRTSPIRLKPLGSR